MTVKLDTWQPWLFPRCPAFWSTLELPWGSKFRVTGAFNFERERERERVIGISFYSLQWLFQHLSICWVACYTFLTLSHQLSEFQCSIYQVTCLSPVSLAGRGQLVDNCITFTPSNAKGHVNSCTSFHFAFVLVTPFKCQKWKRWLVICDWKWVNNSTIGKVTCWVRVDGKRKINGQLVIYSFSREWFSRWVKSTFIPFAPS